MAPFKAGWPCWSDRHTSVQKPGLMGLLLRPPSGYQHGCLPCCSHTFCQGCAAHVKVNVVLRWETNSQVNSGHVHATLDGYVRGETQLFVLKPFCWYSVFSSINTETRQKCCCLECVDHFCLAADLTIMCNRFQKYTFCLSIHRTRAFRTFHLAYVSKEIHCLWWKVWVWPCSIS